MAQKVKLIYIAAQHLILLLFVSRSQTPSLPSAFVALVPDTVYPRSLGLVVIETSLASGSPSQALALPPNPPAMSSATAEPAAQAPRSAASSSSLTTKTTQSLRYLVNPSSSPAPRSLVQRSSLNSLRYILRFCFWRAVRYAKYALIAAGTTALAGTVIGTALPWVGALVFPSLPVAAAMGATTALIKFTWRHRGNHFRSEAWFPSSASSRKGSIGVEPHKTSTGDAREDERRDAREAARAWGME
ncbi:hypothetical protein JCM10212_004387 [Sporobolomyces blumeae]